MTAVSDILQLSQYFQTMTMRLLRMEYLPGVAAASYREFFARTKLITSAKMSKPERIAEEIRNHIGAITKAELVEQVPYVSQTTVQRTLTELTRQGRIIKLGAGRYIKYRWNRDQEDEHQ